MIENLLYLALGLLIALFIGMMVAPAIWNRAVTLTERQLTRRLNPDAKAKIAENDRHFAALAMQSQRDSAAKRELEQQNAEITVELIKHRNQVKELKAEVRKLKQNSKASKTTDNPLKGQIIDLAAQMTSMTAMIEGKDSEIHKALNAKNAKGNDKNSLADKIRILSKKAE